MKLFLPKLVTSIFALSLIVSCKKDNDPPPNKVPVADAGASQAITLPAKSVVLNGSGQDADGQVVAYLWSEVSGPGSASIDNPGSASTAINDLLEGTYIFQLMVTDDEGATGVDTLSVVVNPSIEVTLVAAPSNNPDEFEIAVEGSTDVTGQGAKDLPVEAWTRNGSNLTIRGIIKFDLSSIPSTATITSATLSLYSDPAPYNGNLIDANYGSSNGLYVQQVTSSWSGASLSWTNQPTTSASTQIAVPVTSSSFLDLNIDVTSLVSSMVSTNANYGFLVKLQNETIYNSRIFCSSYNTDATKHPKLTVIYSSH